MGTLNKPGKFDCLKKLDPDEPFFVLCGRDPTAPPKVRSWVEDNAGLQPPEKLEEALQCADAMDAFHGTLKSAETRKLAGLAEPEPKKRPGRHPGPHLVCRLGVPTAEDEERFVLRQLLQAIEFARFRECSHA